MQSMLPMLFLRTDPAPGARQVAPDVHRHDWLARRTGHGGSSAGAAADSSASGFNVGRNSIRDRARLPGGRSSSLHAGLPKTAAAESLLQAPWRAARIWLQGTHRKAAYGGKSAPLPTHGASAGSAGGDDWHPTCSCLVRTAGIAPFLRQIFRSLKSSLGQQ